MRATHNNAGIAAWRCKLKADIGSYEDCEQFMNSDGYSDADFARELGPQMKMLFKDGCYAVKLYNTEIIRYYPDGTFSVDNGGFNTPTTRARLNMVLPRGYHAYHHKKRLGLAGNGHDYSGPTKLWPLYHSVRIEVK